MDRNTALGAAAGVTLAVVGAVSALFMTLDQPADAAVTTPAVEYVDQYGNALGAAPVAASASPDVVLVSPDGTLVDTSVPAADPAAYGDEAEYEEHDEEMEHDEAEYDEHGEEMDHDEYEEDEHEDYDDEDEYEDDDYEDEEEEDEDDD